VTFTTTRDSNREHSSNSYGNNYIKSSYREQDRRPYNKFKNEQFSNKNGKKRTTRFYKAICSMCEAETQVPFRPDGKRPVYCKICYQKVKPKRS